MKKFTITRLPILLILLAVCFLGSTYVQAGTKDMVATKRDKFKDDGVDSMRDVFARRETEDKEYKAKMLENSNETVALLKDIKALLEDINRRRVLNR